MPQDVRLPSRARLIPASLPRLLLVCAVVILIVATFATFLGVAVRLETQGRFDIAFVARLVLDLTLGVALAGILYAVSLLMRAAAGLRAGFSRLEQLAGELRPPVETPHPAPPPSELPAAERVQLAALVAACDEMLALLRDVRENSLLTPDQRAEKATRVEQDEMVRLRGRVTALAADGDFARAVALIGEFERAYPGRTIGAELRGLIDQRRTERQAADTREFTRRVEEFITISAWQRAREVVEELRRRYPEAPVVSQLEGRINREYELYEDAQHRQMYAEIQRFVSRKRYREALAAAETFIERFPLRAESESLKAQLPTLANNAEVAARQEMEAEITELARRGDYAEAKALAEGLIQRWPDSVQAEILRSQLDRLHELATNPNAPPPRVRPNLAT